ncbi:MAG TPA: hypothetical protein VMS00_13245 [Acidimicrobiales bacterium]|nr:hypothetical protein [Acidimicrobiales bacterium]
MTADMDDTLRPECAAVDDDLVELALGSLTGKQRVAALAHMESCARCSAEVDELSKAADQLLHLAPVSEPPIGFEADVFERLGLNLRPPGWRSWLVLRPKLAMAMAACALVVTFGIGAVVGHGTGATGATGATGDRYAPPGPKPPIETAALYSGTHMVGRVLVYAGNPTWLFMYMDDPAWQGAIHCEVVVEQGPTVDLGNFWLSEGKGAWAASLNQPAGRLSQARIVGSDGKVLASATLS